MTNIMLLKLRRIASIGVIVICLFVSPSVTRADSTTVHIYPSSAVDNTPTFNSANPKPVESYDATTPQIQHMAVQDCPAVASTYFLRNKFGWPKGVSSYDETEYIEFSFPATSIPVNAIIDSVSVTNSYFTESNIDAAKLEVWNGTSFVSQSLTVPAFNECGNVTDDTFDLSSTLTTPQQLNNLKMRFMAYRSSAVSGQIVTDNDSLDIAVTYHMPTPPVANNQDVSGAVDSPIPITLAGTDADGNPLTYSIVDMPTKGTLGAVTGNQVTYTPSGTVGDDTFTFKVTGGALDSVPATVTLHLAPGAVATLNLSLDQTSLDTGSSTTLTITGKDTFGNIAASDSSSVIHISSDTDSTIAQSVTLASGTATTSITSAVAGAMNLTASSGSLPSATTTVTFTTPSVPVTEAPVINGTVIPLAGGGGGGGGFSSQSVSAPSSNSVSSSAIIGDINGDGVIDIFDLTPIFVHWGQAYTPADFNSDGVVDLFDFNYIMSHWTL